MNPKITAKAIAKLEGKLESDLVSLNLRTTTPLTNDQFDQLMQWGGRLLYDCAMIALVEMQTGHFNDLAA